VIDWEDGGRSVSLKGTAGAIDNATGVIILLHLAEMLKDY
jgi:Zn-dependent M28 family amino/carboxypeptidase